MKLVLLTRSLAIGGAERQLVALAKSLDKEVFEVTVVSLYGDGPMFVELANAGVPALSLDKRGRWELVRFSERLVTVLRKLQPRIVYSFMSVQNLLAALVKPLLRTTRFVWGVRASYMDLRWYDWLARVTYRLEVRFSRFPDLIVFNSLAGRDYHLAAGFNGCRTVVIPNGVDTKYFAPNRTEALRVRECWQLPERSLVIGIVARLDPMKDHHAFLRAAAILAQSRPDLRFVCIGGGNESYKRELQEFAQGLGLGNKVIWAGSITDGMPAVYSALDLCCSSSSSEGTSNAVAEAMACGVPCVVTDVGDSRLIVGDTGIVVPAKDPEALAAGWTAMAERLKNNPSAREDARTRIETQFGLAALVQKTSDSLLGLL